MASCRRTKLKLRGPAAVGPAAFRSLGQGTPSLQEVEWLGSSLTALPPDRVPPQSWCYSLFPERRDGTECKAHTTPRFRDRGLCHPEQSSRGTRASNRRAGHGGLRTVTLVPLGCERYGSTDGSEAPRLRNPTVCLFSKKEKCRKVPRKAIRNKQKCPLK